VAEAVDVARQADDAFNSHDAEARMAFNTEDTELLAPGGVRLRGREQAGLLAAFWEALPDATITWETQVESGSMVGAEGYLAGTHTGTLRTPQGDIPPSGSSVRLPYVSLKRIEGGKIAAEHLYWDQLEFMQQLGAMPPAPEA
jgi:predicted ester cyclase